MTARQHDEANTIVLDLFERLLVVTLRGAWDWSHARQLCDFLSSLTLERDVMVDLRSTDLFDSASLSSLLALRQRAGDAGRRMEIVSSPFTAALLARLRIGEMSRLERECLDRIRSAGKPIGHEVYRIESDEPGPPLAAERARASV